MSSQNKNVLNWKGFCDPVHGHICLHPVCTAIIDTPEFQRLRDIKQLGGAYYVYPGASHNRFEHSIGVCHLAGELVRTLKERQGLNITDSDVRCVEIAGLCHDLGHGPYSSAFDRVFLPRLSRETAQTYQTTPERSSKIFEKICENESVKTAMKEANLNKKDVQYIKNLIFPPAEKERMEEVDGRGGNKLFLYEIVANERTGVDVDKFDYILRDSQQLGISSSFEFKRFFQVVRVIDQQLCVREKEAFDLYQLFQSRHALHKKAYKHKRTVAAELMLVEALILAKDVSLFPGSSLKIIECLGDTTHFVNYLSDSIFRQIRTSSITELRKSQGLLLALERRKIFPCIGKSYPIAKTECEILKENSSNLDKETKIKDELTKMLDEENAVLKDLIVVQVITLDFGQKNRNPLKELRFYTKRKPDTSFPKDSSEVSQLLPDKIFQEQVVRVYLKHRWCKDQWVLEHNQSQIEFIGTIFRDWCSRYVIGYQLFQQDYQRPTPATD